MNLKKRETACPETRRFLCCLWGSPFLAVGNDYLIFEVLDFAVVYGSVGKPSLMVVGEDVECFVDGGGACSFPTGANYGTTEFVGNTIQPTEFGIVLRGIDRGNVAQLPAQVNEIDACVSEVEPVPTSAACVVLELKLIVKVCGEFVGAHSGRQTRDGLATGCVRLQRVAE